MVQRESRTTHLDFALVCNCMRIARDVGWGPACSLPCRATVGWAELQHADQDGPQLGVDLAGNKAGGFGQSHQIAHPHSVPQELVTRCAATWEAPFRRGRKQRRHPCNLPMAPGDGRQAPRPARRQGRFKGGGRHAKRPVHLDCLHAREPRAARAACTRAARTCHPNGTRTRMRVRRPLCAAPRVVPPPLYTCGTRTHRPGAAHPRALRN